MEPTSAEDPIMQEEIFGPLLPVVEIDGPDVAIEVIRSKPRPLALYIFSGSRRHQKRILETTLSGGAAINTTVLQIANPYLPFGGIGSSGMGQYHGRASFETFTHRKSILRKSNLIEIPMQYPPYNGKLRMLKWFYKVKRA
jgi:aldehyde dehydrogenase (NAD+)